jgi:hypothetical protein
VNVGCRSDADEQAKWFGDAIALKAGKYDHDLRSLRSAVSGLRLLGAGHAPLHRFRLGLELPLSGHREVDRMVAHHAAPPKHPEDPLRAGARRAAGSPRRGARRARRGLRALGRPDGRAHWARDEIPVAAQLAQAAEFLEVANRVGGVEAARALARARRGKQFDPRISRSSSDGEALVAECTRLSPGTR